MLHSFDLSLCDGFRGWIALRATFSGCLRALSGNPCPGCHNPDLWRFHDADESRMSEIFRLFLEQQRDDEAAIDGLVLVGGEPLDQSPELILHVIHETRSFFEDLPVLIYTGYELESVMRRLRDDPKWAEVFKNVYALKTGEYRPDEPPKEGCKLASGNQQYWRVGPASDGGGLRFGECDDSGNPVRNGEYVTLFLDPFGGCES